MPRFEAPAGEYIRRLPQGRPEPAAPAAAVMPAPMPMPPQVSPPGGLLPERRGDDRFHRDQRRERPAERGFDDDARRDEGQAVRGSMYRPPGPPDAGMGNPGRSGHPMPPRRQD